MAHFLNTPLTHLHNCSLGYLLHPLSPGLGKQCCMSIHPCPPGSGWNSSFPGHNPGHIGYRALVLGGCWTGTPLQFQCSPLGDLERVASLLCAWGVSFWEFWQQTWQCMLLHSGSMCHRSPVLILVLCWLEGHLMGCLTPRLLHLYHHCCSNLGNNSMAQS